MKLLKYTIAAMAAAAFLTGCSDTSTVEGKLVFGHEVRSFTADGDTVECWIFDRDGILMEAYRENASMEKYEPVHVKMKVIDKGKAQDGFAADYEKSYELVELIEMTPLNTEE